MTKEIAIAVNCDSDRPTVLGRDLHTMLEVSTAYKDWFPRMCEYGFTEGVDFCSILSESTGGRPATNHQLTIEMAKELCMLQRTPKGKECRQYFIELEKKWNTPELVMARALRMADTKIKKLESTIADQKPLVEFAEHVSQSSDLITVAQMAKLAHDENIQIGRNKLFDWLRDSGYLRRNNEPYQRYVDAGYFDVRESVKYTAYGSRVFTQTFVTGKGQIYLIEKLREEFKAA